MRSIYFLLLMVGVSAAMAEDKKVPRVKAATPERNATFDQNPFDPAAEALPKNYRGHSCTAIAQKIKTINPNKGEFETSAAYDARLEGFRGTTLYGGVTGGSTLAFVPHESIPLGATYNADSATMSLSIYLIDHGPVIVSDTSVGSILVDRKVVGSKAFVGANAYGRKVRVSSTQQTSCTLALKNLDVIRYPGSAMKKIVFQISPEDARATAPNLAALIVGNFAPPLYKEYNGYVKPTLDSPSESWGGGDTLVLNLSEIWIFDKVTGRVFVKSSD